MTEEKKKIEKQIDVVSKDRNWVFRINNELDSEKKWDGQWGYLSGGFSPDKTDIKPSIKDKILELQQEIKVFGTKDIYATSNNNYGSGEKVEMFDNSRYNLKENRGLRALDRKLPKDWKKGKWTPPVDPFDPMSNKKKN